MKKILVSVVILSIAMMSLVQATSAVFEETVKVAGTSFTVGTDSDPDPDPEPSNTALKVLIDPSASADDANLTDSMTGPVFDNITADWTDEVSLKVHNKGTVSLDLVSKTDYISDPDVLRDDIYVEIFEWNDIDNDGIVDTGEEGLSYGYDTLLRWRNDTFPLGQINQSETRGFIMRFDGTGVTDTNYGMNAVYDFLITGVDQTTP